MCPKCDSDEARVLETRKATGTIWRRRQCVECNRVFVTQENVADAFPWAAGAARQRAAPPPVRRHRLKVKTQTAADILGVWKRV